MSTAQSGHAGEPTIDAGSFRTREQQLTAIARL